MLAMNALSMHADLSVSSQPTLYLVDKIECVVCGPESNTPLTNTDETIKRSMDGKLIPLSQQIQNDVVSQQIVADKMPIDPTAADKYIDTLKRQNNLTDTDMADLFEQIGRTFMEGLALLNQQYYHEMFMHYKFKSQQIVTDDVVQEYYDEHPSFSEGQVEIQVAYVDFDDDSKEKLQQSLNAMLQNKHSNDITLEWSSPMEITMRDIATDKRFIFDMMPEEIFIHEGAGSFELYKLISKKEPKMKGLEEMRPIIIEKLTRQKLEGMLESYNQEVRKFVDIIDLSKE